MYIEGLYNYLRDFRGPVKCAMIKSKVGGVSNSAKRDKHVHFNFDCNRIDCEQGTPSPQMGFKEGVGVIREGRGKGRAKQERQEGS
jgi:hypothetical protein